MDLMTCYFDLRDGKVRSLLVLGGRIFRLMVGRESVLVVSSTLWP